MKPYEFSLIRYQHDATGGEFANVGVVMLDVTAARLRVAISDHYERLSDFFGGIDGIAYHALVRQVERALLEQNARLAEPDLLEPNPGSLSEILQQVFPRDESNFLASGVMYGVDPNPKRRLDELFEEFVLRFEQINLTERRDSDAVRRVFDEQAVQTGVARRLKFKFPVESAHYDYTFHAGWANGKPQVMEPISFDYKSATTIVERANTWSGRLYSLSRGAVFQFSALVAVPSEPNLSNAFNRARAILLASPNVRAVVQEQHVNDLIEVIRRDVSHADPNESL